MRTAPAIRLALLKPHRVAYIFFWPHARPWHLLRPQPTLRGIRRRRRVAADPGPRLGRRGLGPGAAMAPAGASPAMPTAATATA